MCSNADDFNNRKLFLTAKLLKQGYRYHKCRRALSKFYHRHSVLIVKYSSCLEPCKTRKIKPTSPGLYASGLSTTSWQLLCYTPLTIFISCGNVEKLPRKHVGMIFRQSTITLTTTFRQRSQFERQVVRYNFGEGG